MTDLNPWIGMGKSVERRVETAQDIFWVTDTYGRFGISFRVKHSIPLKKIPKLNRLLIEMRNIEDQSELNVILSNKEDWELFYLLCKDLIKETNNKLGYKLIETAEKRLMRWQALLKKGVIPRLTIEQQMGLYSELTFLQDFVAKRTNYKSAIVSWVGSDKDRQDFLLKKIAVEVKSHKTSNEKSVRISSKYQLDSGKAKLILAVYSLTPSDEGETILDVINKIRLGIKDEETDLLFNAKLIECNFIPELLTQSLQGFFIDEQTSFLVENSFPRIQSRDISPLIKNLTYSIDLTHCDKYKINLDKTSF